MTGAIGWDEVEVDDCYTGIRGNISGTTLGPRWPEIQIVASVFLEEQFLLRLAPARRPACPPKGMSGRDYEHKMALLGCSTAVHPTGQRTIRRMARILGVPVYGTTKFLFKSHYNCDGFDPLFTSLLLESSELPRIPARL